VNGRHDQAQVCDKDINAVILRGPNYHHGHGVHVVYPYTCMLSMDGSGVAVRCQMCQVVVNIYGSGYH